MLAGLRVRARPPPLPSWPLGCAVRATNPSVAADIYRPAAVQRLVVLGEQISVGHTGAPGEDPVKIARDALAELGARAIRWSSWTRPERLHIDDA